MFPQNHLNQEIKQESNILVDKILMDCSTRCGNEKYSDLVALMGALRGLSILHQTHHWQSFGEKFYSDHLLFQKLYEAANDQVDDVAEKVVGLSDKAELAGFSKHVISTTEFLSLIKNHATSDDFAKRSLDAEKIMVSMIETIMNRLEQRSLLTRGLDNLLGGLADEHEKFVYLLERRIRE